MGSFCWTTAFEDDFRLADSAVWVGEGESYIDWLSSFEASSIPPLYVPALIDYANNT